MRRTHRTGLKSGTRDARNGYVKNGNGVEEMDIFSGRAIIVKKGSNVELNDMNCVMGIQKTIAVPYQSITSDDIGLWLYSVHNIIKTSGYMRRDVSGLAGIVLLNKEAISMCLFRVFIPESRSLEINPAMLWLPISHSGSDTRIEADSSPDKCTGCIG